MSKILKTNLNEINTEDLVKVKLDGFVPYVRVNGVALGVNCFGEYEVRTPLLKLRIK